MSDAARLTGKIRYRISLFRKLILQVEWSVVNHTYSDSERINIWVDARPEDVGYSPGKMTLMANFDGEA